MRTSLLALITCLLCSAALLAKDTETVLPSFDAAIEHPKKPYLYFFSGDKYYRFSLAADAFEPPRRIGHPGWKGVWTDGIDAALLHPNGKAYFFKGNKYRRFDFDQEKVDKEATIDKDGWSGLWTNGFDAAVMHPNGNAYFFRGNKYRRFDFEDNKVDKEATINEDGWMGLWTDGIGAGVRHPNGNLYFFKGNKYRRFDVGKDEVDKRGTVGQDGWHAGDTIYKQIARRYACQEVDDLAGAYAREVFRLDFDWKDVGPARVKVPSANAQRIAGEIVAYKHQLKTKIMDGDEEIEEEGEEKKEDEEDERPVGTPKKVWECMKRKSEERKKDHPDDEADPENYRWACYAEYYVERAGERFARWFEEKARKSVEKWGRDTDEKIRKWIADRKIERSTKKTWDDFVKRGRIGGEVGKASESVKDFIDNVSPF